MAKQHSIGGDSKIMLEKQQKPFVQGYRTQWVNCLRNNIFVNLPPLSLLCEISVTVHLAQSGLIAGRWQAGRQAGR